MSRERDRLVEHIAQDFLGNASALGVTGLEPRIAEALRAVAREDFVPAVERELADLDSPLPIGSGQTISQPFIVALMTQWLEVAAGNRVLELGTGSGYQAAILDTLGVAVVSLEILPELAEQAAKRLARLGYRRVAVHPGDAWGGWPDSAPYDGILVTAAAPRVPAPLIEQLKPGGRLVIPLGAPDVIQRLVRFRRDDRGALHAERELPVRFVPITGPMRD
ncbi:MAG: protein-L-isoaspartate(D-aspartate) O-methyltransferase [Chromatiaceae bacterium]|nr:protein-L-isoaspartate(D-aspartate) O-methyltransferase [Chromatiaceae bacterium]